MKGALERERIPYVIFDEIEENPSVETVMKARALGVSEGADFVIGVGGGFSHGCFQGHFTDDGEPGA